MISPLLVHIYLNKLDSIWKGKGVEKRFGERLVGYGDDIFVVSMRDGDRVLRGVSKEMGGLELSLNKGKTRIVISRRERFNFLGFTIRVVRSRWRSER